MSTAGTWPRWCSIRRRWAETTCCSNRRRPVPVVESADRAAAAAVHHPQRPAGRGPGGRAAQHHEDRRPRHRHADPAQGLSDLYQLYVIAQRDGIDYNVACIPQSFTERLDAPFDQTYMRNLFAVGATRC